MSDHEGVPEADLGLDDGAASEQGGWSPVMGTPPPDDPGIGAVDAPPPPHEDGASDLVPPAPPEPELDVAPPPPPLDGALPPELPDVGPPVDLSGDGVALGEPPMPPVQGDAGAPPPPPGATDGIDLGEGPPVAPPVDGGPGDGTQTPWPDQGAPPTADVGAADVAPGEVDLGDPPMPPVQGDTTTAPPAPGTVEGPEVEGPPVAPDGESTPTGAPQSPVPDMGTPDATTPVGTIDAEVVLDDPPMPPVTGDRDTAPPTESGEPGDEPPVAPAPPGEPTAPGDIVVEPGTERVAAAALTGWYLDTMDVNDPLRARMVDLVEQYAQDGEITMEELQRAFDEAEMLTSTDGSPDTMGNLIQQNEQTVILTTTDEGTGLYRARLGDGQVELESLRSRAVYAAEPQGIARAWRDTGAAVIAAPAVLPEAAPAAVVEEEDAGGSDGGARDAFVAGAILLPIAGGAAYFATRKIR